MGKESAERKKQSQLIVELKRCIREGGTSNQLLAIVDQLDKSTRAAVEISTGDELDAVQASSMPSPPSSDDHPDPDINYHNAEPHLIQSPAQLPHIDDPQTETAQLDVLQDGLEQLSHRVTVLENRVDIVESSGRCTAIKHY